MYCSRLGYIKFEVNYGDELFLPTAEKYPLPQRLQTFRKQFLEASNWFKAYDGLEERYLICGRLC